MTKVNILWDILLALIATANFALYFFFDGDVVNVVFGCTMVIILGQRRTN